MTWTNLDAIQRYYESEDFSADSSLYPRTKLTVF